MEPRLKRKLALYTVIICSCEKSNQWTVQMWTRDIRFSSHESSPYVGLRDKKRQNSKESGLP